MFGKTLYLRKVSVDSPLNKYLQDNYPLDSIYRIAALGKKERDIKI